MRKVYLTLGAIVRDQAHYVKEWLTFYYVIGVERMVIVLHQCRDDTEQQIRSLPFFSTHIKLYRVNVSSSDTSPVQVGTYKRIFAEWGPSTEWLMIADADEFYFGTVEDHLPTVLGRYEDYGGLAANWVMFGPDGHVLRPQGLVTESLLKRLPLDSGYNRSIKVVNRACDVLMPLSPHTCLTRRPIVTENYESRFIGTYGLLPHADARPSWDIVRCNHYFVRSMEDWVEKAHRGSCNGGNKQINREYHLATMSMFSNFINCKEEDTAILRFVPRIKEVLSL
jgi:hypothetical protein